MQSKSSNADRGSQRRTDRKDDANGNANWNKQKSKDRDDFDRRSRLSGAKVPAAKNVTQSGASSSGTNAQQAKTGLQPLRKTATPNNQPNGVAQSPETNAKPAVASSPSSSGKSWAQLLSPQKQEVQTSSEAHVLKSLGGVKHPKPAAEAAPRKLQGDSAASQPAASTDAVSPSLATKNEIRANNAPTQKQKDIEPQAEKSPRSWASLVSTKAAASDKKIIPASEHKQTKQIEIKTAVAEERIEQAPAPSSPQNIASPISPTHVEPSKPQQPSAARNVETVRKPLNVGAPSMHPHIIPPTQRPAAVMVMPSPSPPSPHGFAFQRGGGVILHHPLPGHGMVGHPHGMVHGAPVMMPMSMPPPYPPPPGAVYTSGIPVPGAVPMAVPPWGMPSRHHPQQGPMPPAMMPVAPPPHIPVVALPVAPMIPPGHIPPPGAIPPGQSFSPTMPQPLAPAAMPGVPHHYYPSPPASAGIPPPVSPPLETTANHSLETQEAPSTVLDKEEHTQSQPEATPSESTAEVQQPKKSEPEVAVEEPSASQPEIEQQKEEAPAAPAQPMSWAERAKAAAAATPPPATHKPHPAQRLSSASTESNQRQQGRSSTGGSGRGQQRGDNNGKANNGNRRDRRQSKGEKGDGNQRQREKQQSNDGFLSAPSPLASPPSTPKTNGASKRATTSSKNEGVTVSKSSDTVLDDAAASSSSVATSKPQSKAIGYLDTGDAKEAVLSLWRNTEEFLQCEDTFRLLPRGIGNPGNLCFMNSVIQALLGSNSFCKFICTLHVAGSYLDSKQSPTLFALAQLAEKLRTKEGFEQLEDKKSNNKNDGERSSSSKKSSTAHVVVLGGQPFAPSMLMDMAQRFNPRRKAIAAAEQEDAAEFYNFFMNCLHQELSHLQKQIDAGSSSESPEAQTSSPGAAHISEADDSDEWLTKSGKRSVRQQEVGITPTEPETVVSSLFQGKIASSVACAGAPTSVTVEPFNVLQLHIHPEQIHSVADSLDALTASEKVQDYKPGGKGEPTVATKTLRLQNLPPVLVLHMMRFEFAFDRGSAKLTKAVTFESKMTIRSSWLAAGSKDKGAVYQLIATVSHHGKNMANGHYTADVLQQDGRWLRFDDGNVFLVSQQVVLSDRPYLLFYARVG